MFNLLKLRIDVFLLPLVEPLISTEAAAPLPSVVCCLFSVSVASSELFLVFCLLLLLIRLIFPPYLSPICVISRALLPEF